MKLSFFFFSWKVMRLSDAEARVCVYASPLWRCLLCQSCNLNNNHSVAWLCLNGEKKTITLGNLKPFFSFVIAIFRFLRGAIFCWLKASNSIKFEKTWLSAHVTQLCGRSLSKNCHTKPARGYFLTIAEFHVGRDWIESHARLSLPVCALNKRPFIAVSPSQWLLQWLLFSCTLINKTLSRRKISSFSLSCIVLNFSLPRGLEIALAT